MPDADPIDRIAPTRRPEGRPGGYQQWRDLLFVHWPVPVEVLRPLVPAPLAIDTHDGVAYVGLVPFEMRGVRPWRWWPRRLAFAFPEANLRTYVHLGGRDPGVWFLSLEATSWLAVRAARLGWGLPYFHARMQWSLDHAASVPGPDNRTGGEIVNYVSHRRGRHGARLVARYTVGQWLGPSEPGTLEHWLLERYLLYAVRRGWLWRGRVAHAPYPARLAAVSDIDETLVAAAGLPATAGLPPLAHYSVGVDVDVFPLRRVQRV